MGDLSTHFSQSEFVCECCGRSHTMSKLLINRLEQMFVIMDAKIIHVNSGYRCENNPYGYKTDAHRRGSYTSTVSISFISVRIVFATIT